MQHGAILVLHQPLQRASHSSARFNLWDAPQLSNSVPSCPIPAALVIVARE